MGAVYADSSALVKLVVDEAESEAVKAFVSEVGIVSSELTRAEVPRALRRIASEHPSFAFEEALLSSEELLEEVTLAPTEGLLLEAAGELPEPNLRTLDAIHVITAIYLHPIEAFLTYDERQATSARLAGLPTAAPGS
ncbi:MAG TPA: type II toxin-antitoxin system VapC family toxin [Solirubrobacterales bacterium]|nr:type II toxin-antitoxin system VapC family toxin [Solirubrobacterales bacterium]